MGVHYLNDAYAKDPAIRAAKPELLLYEPQPGGRLKLVAVEYFRPDVDQDLTTDPDRPSWPGFPSTGRWKATIPECRATMTCMPGSGPAIPPGSSPSTTQHPLLKGVDC